MDGQPARPLDGTHAGARLGLRFTVPDGFVVGRYRSDPVPADAQALGFSPPWENAVVLVEPGVLGDLPLEGIPLGEVPTITIDRLDPRSPVLRMTAAGDSLTLGTHRVYRLPGYPGPYGDQAFYYLVRLSQNEMVELLAHRHYFDRAEDEWDTGYDQVIEAIIETLEAAPPL